MGNKQYFHFSLVHVQPDWQSQLNYSDFVVLVHIIQLDRQEQPDSAFSSQKEPVETVRTFDHDTSWTPFTIPISKLVGDHRVDPQRYSTYHTWSGRMDESVV